MMYLIISSENCPFFRNNRGILSKCLAVDPVLLFFKMAVLLFLKMAHKMAAIFQDTAIMGVGSPFCIVFYFFPTEVHLK